MDAGHAEYLLSQARRKMANHILGAARNHGMYNMSLHQDSSQQVYSEGSWYKDPRLGHANNFAASPGTFATSPGTLNTWSSADYSLVSRSKCNALRSSSAIDSSFFGDQSLGSSEGFISYDYNMGVGTAFSTFEGSNLLAPMGKQHASSQMVVSPEPMSCITSCSDADMYSDTGIYDCGSTFPGNGLLPVSKLSSEPHVQQECLSQGASNVYGGLLENNQNAYSMGIPSLLGENGDVQSPHMQFLQQGLRSSINFGMPSMACQVQMEPNIQYSGAQQMHQLHQQSYGQFHEPLEAQSRYNPFEQGDYNKGSMGQDISTRSHLPSEQAKGLEFVVNESSSFLNGLIGDAQLTPSRETEKILLSYMKYAMEHKEANEVNFTQYMHSVECTNCSCNCDKYFTVASHFTTCCTRQCKVCGPVRNFYTNGKPPFGSIKRAFGEANNFGDRNMSSELSQIYASSSKRQKIGNIVSSAAESSYTGVATVNQPCEHEQFSHLKELPEALVSGYSAVTNDSPAFQDSTVSSSYGSSSSCVFDSSRNQPCDLGRLPRLQEWPEAPVSNDLDKMGVSTPLQYLKSASSTRNNVVEAAQRGVTLSTPCKELIGCSRYGETINIGRDNVVKFAQRADTLTTPCKEPIDCSGDVEIINIGGDKEEPADDPHSLNSFRVSFPSNEHLVCHNEESCQRTMSDQEVQIKSDLAAPVANSEIKTDASNEHLDCHNEESCQRTMSDQEVQLKSDLAAPVANSEIKTEASNEHLDFHNEERQERTKSDPETHIKIDSAAPVANSEVKAADQEITGVSLIDYFTAEEANVHLCNLRQGNAQDVEPMPYSVGDNSCQLCAMNKLPFAPLSVYCSFCGVRMKRNQTYHGALEEMNSQYCFCTTCFKRFRGNEISCYGITISKAKFCKKKNSHQDEEAWVQCDKCESWQHQICALYNDKKDQGGQARYICPKCYLDGIAAGKLMPLPKKDASGAKDLPTSKLSNHIEQRLRRCLKKEREERAKAMNTNIDEVPGASDLVVRVVSSVNKSFEVKQQFSNIFQDEDYPSQFPYKSKAILLFQKIEGVDIFLFGFYVQEYGSKCAHPNRRCVYISYLDSVKYFRPEVKTVSGEGLRTFVYHEILIGYLDYCKKRGFATCYIWTCPPVKGEDFILYCHPETQKTPKTDKLRQWYTSMLRKAAEHSIVVDCSNLYDEFFVHTGEPDMKVTAARLPQFDGAYWSGAGVEIIKKIEQGCEVGSQSKSTRVPTKRSLKAMGHKNLSADATKDVVLMQKLGQNILPVKENFMVVHLQFSCSRCQEVIQSESRWHCNECKHFQLCARCYDVEKNRQDGRSHISSRGEKHFLFEVQGDGLPVDTEDNDLIVEKGFLENRHSFLSFCEENHYQFDTLRRAKHSSMMVLYQLHDSIMPCYKATCYICHKNILLNNGWSCETCPWFDACDECYRGKGEEAHIHKLSPRSSIFSCGSISERQRQAKIRALIDLMKHACKCTIRLGNCSYPNCLNYKKLHDHFCKCNGRFNGGCKNCMHFRRVLRIHTMNCEDSNCPVVHCTYIRERAKQAELQSEMRRRAAVVAL